MSVKRITVEESDLRFHDFATATDFNVPPEICGTRRVGIALLGCGRMGAVHLENLVRNPRAKLLYVYDHRVDRLQHLSKKYFLEERGVSMVTGESGWQRILDDKHVESLFVSTKTSTHEKYVLEGLQHGKHILCEKPLAMKAEQVERIVSTAEKKKLKLMVALQRRYDPSLRQLQKQAISGGIGEIQTIRTIFHDSPSPCDKFIGNSGGFIHDCFVHDLDLILWVARELPVEVHAIGVAHSEAYKQNNDFDLVMVTFKFASGLMSQSEMGRYSSNGYDQRMEVFGPKGVVRVDSVPHVHCERIDELGLSKMSSCYSFSRRYYDAYNNQVTDFFNLVEGLKVLERQNGLYLAALNKILDAVDESARTSKLVSLRWSKEELEKTFQDV